MAEDNFRLFPLIRISASKKIYAAEIFHFLSEAFKRSHQRTKIVFEAVPQT